MASVLFRTQSRYPINRKLIQKKINEFLVYKVHRETQVSIMIVGDRQMRELNQKYRQLDATTDVLSFPLNEHLEKNDAFVVSPDNILRLGDIVVSYPQAREAAAEEEKLVDDKINELVLHGLNHLLGIHHPE